MLTNDPNSPCGVLYVDDEEIALKYFRLTFSSKYPVFTASSAEEGLNILRREAGTIGIVVSDQRMPEVSGSDFLAQVRAIDPATVRILTTAYSNLESAISAVNKGFIYQYVTKPWEVDDLEMVLARAADYHRVLTERNKLLAVKLTFLQRMLFADRIRLMLLFCDLQSEVESKRLERALASLVEAAPLWLFEKQFSGRASLGQFDFTKLLPQEVDNGRKFLKFWQSFPAGADVLADFKAALANRFGIESHEIEISEGKQGGVTLTSDVDNFEFQSVLFSLLGTTQPETVSVLLLRVLALLLSQGNETLTIRLVGLDSAIYLYQFNLTMSGESKDPLSIFFERISAHDISEL